MSKGRVRVGPPSGVTPDHICASISGVRPSTGMFSTISAETTCPTEPVALSSSGASAVMVTASVTAPISSCRSISRRSLALIVMPSRTSRFMPAASAVIRYDPGGRNGSVYCPSSAVTVLVRAPVSTSTASTRAAGMTAFDASTTRPEMVERNSWAGA